MNKINFVISLILLLGIYSCQNDENIQPMEMDVNSFSDVSINGNLKVNFVSTSNSNSAGRSLVNNDTYKVTINATEKDRNNIQVESEGGVLRITANEEIELADSISIQIISGAIHEIRLENDQHAIFDGYFDQEELIVVTEAKSHLSLLNTRVDYLTCRTEGESTFELSTYTDIWEGDLSYTLSRGELINDSTLLLDGNHLLTSDSVRMDENKENWIVFGGEVFVEFTSQQLDFVTQGETRIDAAFARANTIDINLEGSSEASVYAIEAVNGKGEGESILYYRDMEGLDLSGFTLTGGAQALPTE